MIKQKFCNSHNRKLNEFLTPWIIHSSPLPVLQSTSLKQRRCVQSRVWSSCWRGCRSSSTSVIRSRSPTSNCWNCSGCWLNGCTAGMSPTQSRESVFNERWHTYLGCSFNQFRRFICAPPVMMFYLPVDSCHTVGWLWWQQINDYQQLKPSAWWAAFYLF